MIGSRIDEHRKLVTVMSIIDATHFYGEWKGTVYEARAFPSTSLLTVGDAAFCHVLPNNAELVAILVQKDNLWFSPGGQAALNDRGELWRYDGTACTMMWRSPREYEYISHLCWSQLDTTLYMFTYYTYPPSWVEEIRIYSVNLTTGLPTLVYTWLAADPQDPEPCVDSAQFGNYIYTLHNAWNGGAGNNQSCVRRWDPSGPTWTEVLNFFNDFASLGYAGGIAVDPVGNVLVASDGSNAYRSPNGNPASFVFDANIDVPFGSFDNFALLTHRNADDYVYGAQNDPANPGDPSVIKRTGAGVWVGDLFPAPQWPTGVVALSQEYVADGTPTAIWLQRWSWAFAVERAEVWRKPVAGAWGMDWAGPPINVGWGGMYSQGITQFRLNMTGLFFDRIAGVSRLYERAGAGVWNVIQSWNGYQMLGTHAYSTGMTVAPNSLKMCHVV